MNQQFQNSPITVTQQDIVSLYERFYQLDHNNYGFIPSDEFLSITKFVVNPLSQGLLRILYGFNFNECIPFFMRAVHEPFSKTKLNFFSRFMIWIAMEKLALMIY